MLQQELWLLLLLLLEIGHNGRVEASLDPAWTVVEGQGIEGGRVNSVCGGREERRVCGIKGYV